MSTILIADDEARIRRLVSDFLKRDGHTIVEAADGKEALNILENRRPGLDMAILDVMMPGLDQGRSSGGPGAVHRLSAVRLTAAKNVGIIPPE